ncbi:hypothetical protein Ddye_004108 [Dipteronia dyeriana]|uniref:Uncharacterized protein n=1 Tax=Dipteronia dyeriana TaxID=168575 RepID=A0AAD9XTJ5_9ROSI|nr:hypothetical protein Ddye_004108 [Dipteronia dyeriana]
MTKEYSQQGLLDAQKTDGINAEVKEALLNLAKLSRNGLEKLMRENKLDAVVTPGYEFRTVLAIGGYPGNLESMFLLDMIVMVFLLAFSLGIKGHKTKAYRDCIQVRASYQDQEASSSNQALKRFYNKNMIDC